MAGDCLQETFSAIFYGDFSILTRNIGSENFFCRFSTRFFRFLFRKITQIAQEKINLLFFEAIFPFSLGKLLEKNYFLFFETTFSFSPEKLQ